MFDYLTHGVEHPAISILIEAFVLSKPVETLNFEALKVKFKSFIPIEAMSLFIGRALLTKAYELTKNQVKFNTAKH